MFSKMKKFESKLLVVGVGIVLIGLSGCRFGNEGPMEIRKVGVVKGCPVSYVEGVGPYAFTLVECEGGQGGKGETLAANGEPVSVRDVGKVKSCDVSYVEDMGPQDFYVAMCEKAAATTTYKYTSGKSTYRSVAIEVGGGGGSEVEEGMESAADRVRRLEEEERKLKRARALEKLSAEERAVLGVVEKN